MDKGITLRLNGKPHTVDREVYYAIKKYQRNDERYKADITRRQVEIERLNDIINEFEISHKG